MTRNITCQESKKKADIRRECNLQEANKITRVLPWAHNFFIHCTADCLATAAFDECNEFSRCLLTYLPAEILALIVAGFNLGVGYQV